MASSEKLVFMRFAQDTEALENLELFLERLCASDYGALASLSINQCNAAYGRFGKDGKSFSEADVDVELNKDTLIHFGAIFKDAFYMVLDYIKDQNEPPDPLMSKILSKLLSFWLDTSQHKILKMEDKKVCECELTVRLAEHLFSKLAVSPSYKLDKNSKQKSDICLCGCKKDVGSHYGDTSIGNKKVWHGCVDIMLDGCMLPIAVVNDQVAADLSAGNSSTEEENLEEEAIESQIIAETIVFSFTEKKKHPLNNFLIPTIGVNKSHVVFHFYDSENDVLLRSRSFKFFYDDDLNYMSILAIWFVVNYRYLCSGLTKDHLERVKKANFPEHADSQFSIYEDELTFGGDISSERCKRVNYEPLSFPTCHVCKVSKMEERK